ncbi:uncharacterized protein LOC143767133 [Ranitomeya variabilis]|uniref:uncharacterized protein LOC143767133 n=1 Tax=Ranitomeya variabilis TaxID=490064 RepID=UPI004055BEDE
MFGKYAHQQKRFRLLVSDGRKRRRRNCPRWEAEQEQQEDAEKNLVGKMVSGGHLEEGEKARSCPSQWEEEEDRLSPMNPEVLSAELEELCCQLWQSLFCAAANAWEQQWSQLPGSEPAVEGSGTGDDVSAGPVCTEQPYLWSAALQVEVSTISDPLSEDLLQKRIFLIYPSQMDMDRDKMAERLLHLTLEILFRLTGEDYTVVNKTSSDRCQDPVSEGWGRPLSPITGPPPHPLIHEDINDQKILELTYKMIELLTGEVPIRCQDVAVYFSMEEWEYLEGHRDLYKNVIMEVPQRLTSPDLSSKRTTPERCPRPLLPQDCNQEDPNAPQDHQGEDLTHINTTETYVRGDEQCKEEIPTYDYPV